MPKYFRILALVVVCVIVLTGTANALSVDWFDVNLTVNDESTSYKTKANTVGKFLNENNIELNNGETVTPPEIAPLSPSKTNSIVITSFINVMVYIDGESANRKVQQGTTTGELLSDLEKENRIKYVFNGNTDELIRDNSELILTTVTTDVEVSKLPIMFETQVVSDAALEKDTEQVVREGVAGELQLITNVSYRAGKVVKTQVMSENVVKHPVSKIIKIGTKKPKPKVQTEIGNMPYKSVMPMVATAYTAGFESTGKNPGDPGYGVTASGKHVAHGIVAVDPEVIPLGTKLFVQGYGMSVAADRGSAIVGNRIDLYHESLDDAKKFGRRTVDVYILEN